MLKSRIYLVSLMLICSIYVFGQQQAMFTQYMFNGLALNPAYAGSHESISMTALARVQWVGVDGAPNTQTFSAHTPVPGTQAAFGGVFVRDEIGITTQNGFFLSYAYRIKVSDQGTFSMGLQGGISNFDNNYSELGVIDDSPLSGNFSAWKPNFGTGVYFYNQRFYAGVSVPFLLNQELETSDSNNPSEQIRHYFATAGTVFPISPLVKLKPSILLKMVEGAPIEMDINANLILDETIWIGLSYRSGDSMDALLEFQVSPQFRVGYAYDWTLSDFNQVNSGSHELALNYRLVFPKYKMVTPRYF